MRGIYAILAMGVAILAFGMDRAQAAHPVVVQDASGNAVAVYEGSHALVIGVSRFGSGFAPLPWVPDAVSAVATALAVQEFAVDVLLDPDAEELKAGVERFLAAYGTAPNNRLLVYFVGHVRTQFDHEGRPLPYLVPRNVRDPSRNRFRFTANALSLSDVTDGLAKASAAHALLVLDAALPDFAGASAAARNVGKATGWPARQVVVSGAAHGNGADSGFAGHFVDGIRGAADGDRDGLVTASQLAAFLAGRLADRARPRLVPSADGWFARGDFVFASVKGSVAGAPGAGAMCNE